MEGVECKPLMLVARAWVGDRWVGMGDSGGLAAAVRACAWVMGGDLLAAGYADGSLMLWRRLVRVPMTSRSFSPHPSPAAYNSVTMSLSQRPFCHVLILGHLLCCGGWLLRFLQTLWRLSACDLDTGSAISFPYAWDRPLSARVRLRAHVLLRSRKRRFSTLFSVPPPPLAPNLSSPRSRSRSWHPWKAHQLQPASVRRGPGQH